MFRRNEDLQKLIFGCIIFLHTVDLRHLLIEADMHCIYP
jgi:hypothetical protein